MSLRWMAITVLACTGWLAALPVAHAEDLKVLETGPAANAVLSSPSDGFFVRFNQPVDHIKSEFIIKRGNDVVQVLHARFKAEPNTLYAERSPLPAGNYTLVWSVRALDGRQIAVGEIDFKSQGQ